MDWLGSPSSAMDWLGSPPWAMGWLDSLSGHVLPWDHPSQGLDSGKPSLFDAGLLLFGNGQSQMDVLSLDPGYLLLCTHCASWV